MSCVLHSGVEKNRPSIPNVSLNMYFIVSSVVLLYIYFAIESTTATENGYIVAELPEIPCKDPSSAIPACSGSLGYKIPDFKNYPNFPNLTEARKTVAHAKLLFGILGNQKCSKAGTKYLCEAAYPFRCRDTHVEVDGKELEATCNEGRNDCSGLKATLRDSIFKCSGIANDPTWKKKIPRKLTCVDFPVLNNDPYSCEANYKVFNFFGNATMLKVVADEIAFAHKILKSSNVSDAECEQNAADVVCNLIPACSKDRSKVVSQHSRQDCRKIMGCLNKTNNANLIQGANDLCKAFPDGKTAKKYSLENVYDNKAASHAMASTMILCVAILVAQCFF